MSAGTPPRDSAPALPRGLALGARNKAEWDQPQARRQGLRDLHRLHRYGMSFRASQVLALADNPDPRLAGLEQVLWYLAHPYFTGLIVLEGATVVLERYASDFGPGQIHSIQSITKTSVNLFAGRLIDAGLLDPRRAVADYLPEVGSGYAAFPVQDLLDMAVVNDYSEDYYDPSSSVGLLEDAHGWRILAGYSHVDLRTFLATITGPGPQGGPRLQHYKTANTDVVAWICERVAGHDLRRFYREVIEAAGMEERVHLSVDRAGTPFAGGGLHMTLRDLARYGLLLARGGHGVAGSQVGSAVFRDATRAARSAGTPSQLGHGYYRNFLETDGDWIGHNGYGGQWLMAYPESEIVIACLSGVSDDGGHDWAYLDRLAGMGEQIAGILRSGANTCRSKPSPSTTSPRTNATAG